MVLRKLEELANSQSVSLSDRLTTNKNETCQTKNISGYMPEMFFVKYIILALYTPHKKRTTDIFP